MLIRLAVALLALLCLPTAANAVCTVSDPPPFATTTQMGTQNSGAVSITGGCIDGTPIGENRPSTGHFTNLRIENAISVAGRTIDITAPPYNAVCDGVTDDSAAIQAAVSAATAGVDVQFPPRTCFIGTTQITVGNGSSSAWSTLQGIIFRGADGANTLFGVLGNADQAVARIKYTGTGPAVVVQGPLHGWGLQGLQIECSNAAGSIGIKVLSGMYGDSRNISFKNCRTGILSDTVDARPSGVAVVNSMHNNYENVQIVLNASVATTYNGIIETGSSDTDNSSYNNYKNVSIYASGVSGATINDIVLGVADSDRFEQIHLYGPAVDDAQCVTFPFLCPDGPQGITRRIVFDYTNHLSPVFPTGNHLHEVDAIKATVANLGTPDPTSNLSNFWYMPISANGGRAPVLPHLIASAIFPRTWDPELRGSTTTGTVAYSARAGYWTSSYYDINIRFTMNLSSWSGFVGNIQIGGLPVPIDDDVESTAVRSPCAVGGVSGLTLDGGFSQIAAWVDATTQTIQLKQNGSASSGIRAISFPNIAQDASVTLHCRYRRKVNY